MSAPTETNVSSDIKQVLEEMNTQAKEQYLDPEKIGEIKELLGNNTLLADYWEKNVEKWKSTPVKIAFIGKSGTGKSSLINAIRGLGPKEPLSAQVGSSAGPVTVAIKCYEHPDNKLIEYYDLPGVGTEGFDRNTYLDKITFHQYDAFVLLTKDRFEVTDKWLVEQMEQHSKIYFFAVTHIDEKENKICHDEDIPEDKDVSWKHAMVRNKTEQEFQEILGSTRVFLISSIRIHQKKWDLADLKAATLNKLPKIKCEAMVLSASRLAVSSHAFVDEVTKTLKSRVWKIALVSGIIGTNPIPLTSLIVDNALLAKETLLYLKAYGLDPESIRKKSTEMKLSVKVIHRNSGMDESFVAPIFNLTELTSFAVQGALKVITGIVIVEEVLESVARFIPAIGAFVAGGLSAGTVGYMLYKIIDDFDKIARKIITVSKEDTTTAVE